MHRILPLTLPTRQDASSYLHAKAIAFSKGKPTPFEAQASDAFWKDKHFVFDVVIVYSMDEVDRTIPNDNLIERLGDFIEEIHEFN